MDDRFFHAFLHPSVSVAGRRLRAFTVWNQLLLAAIGSPFVTGQGRIRPHDLLAAVKCCRADYPSRPSIKPTLRDVLWTFRYSRNHRLFKGHVETFAKWLSIQCSPPKYYRVKGPGKTQTVAIDRTPRPLSLACALMSHGGLPPKDAWNCPVGQAMWMEAIFAKQEGAEINFLDDADLCDDDEFKGMTDSQILDEFKKHFPAGKAESEFMKWKEARRA